MPRCLPPELADRLQDCALSPRTVPAGAGQGRHRARAHGSSVEFADYRDYAPGDPPNRIDWSVYARSDRILVRRFEDETALRVHVLLDRSESMAFGSPAKLAYAAQLAAGLLYVAVRQGDAAALHTLDEKVASSPTVRSPAALLPQLDAIDRLTASGKSAIAAGLRTFAEGGPEKGLVVIISDLLEDADGILSAVRHLRHAGHRVALWQVLDRAEIQLSMDGQDGLLELDELETGRRLLVEVDEFREAYAQEVAAHLDRLHHGCAHADAVWRLCDTAVTIDEALRAGIRGL